MAFTFTKDIEFNHGGAKVVTGTWTVTGATATGEITTGLGTINYIQAAIYAASTASALPAFNETFPFDSGAVTLIATSGTTGGWVAIGL